MIAMAAKGRRDQPPRNSISAPQISAMTAKTNPIVSVTINQPPCVQLSANVDTIGRRWPVVAGADTLRVAPPPTIREMPFRLDGRVALITGAGSEHGIGRAIATAFATAGASVGLVDMDAAGAERNAAALQTGAEALGCGVDVTHPESVRAAVERVEAALGPVDVLVNCAGITRGTPLWETSLDEFDLVLNVNLRGGFVCLQAVLPGMMQRRQGRIIWMSSIAGKQGGGVFGAAH
jgi:hypothetical protein